MAYLCKKKNGGGASFGVQLPRDGMKILQWSSNPRLPSKNIPLPPRRDPDLFACRAEAGRGWAALTGGQGGDRRGQADGGEQSGATHRLDGGVKNITRFVVLLSDKEYRN